MPTFCKLPYAHTFGAAKTLLNDRRGPRCTAGLALSYCSQHCHVAGLRLLSSFSDVQLQYNVALANSAANRSLVICLLSATILSVLVLIVYFAASLFILLKYAHAVAGS